MLKIDQILKNEVRDFHPSLVRVKVVDQGRGVVFYGNIRPLEGSLFYITDHASEYKIKSSNQLKLILSSAYWMTEKFNDALTELL